MTLFDPEVSWLRGGALDLGRLGQYLWTIGCGHTRTKIYRIRCCLCSALFRRWKLCLLRGMCCSIICNVFENHFFKKRGGALGNFMWVWSLASPVKGCQVTGDVNDLVLKSSQATACWSRPSQPYTELQEPWGRDLLELCALVQWRRRLVSP